VGEPNDAIDYRSAVQVPTDIDVLGLTLEEFATKIGTTPRAARDDYRELTRTGAGVVLPEPVRVQQEAGLLKFCLEVGGAGGTRVETESVVIPMSGYRGTTWRTLCVSSQVGCRMGCTFCETARMGLVRNLTAAEIVAQFAVARALIPQSEKDAWTDYRYFGSGIKNIVFMGMGEPLDNFDEVTRAIRVLNEPNGVAFPHKQITVSTVGRVDGLRRLGELGWPNLRIAISLNAATDDLRDEIIPLNRAMPLADLKRALRDYPLTPRGLFLIEYVLLGGFNDSDEDARQVAEFCRDIRCVVNVIPYNPQRSAVYETPDDEAVYRFVSALRRYGLFAKRRVTQGVDLMGACGQLGNPALRKSPAAPR
jgi:23S rRNA (adenine2503-C2)-methyltransferase